MPITLFCLVKVPVTKIHFKAAIACVKYTASQKNILTCAVGIDATNLKGLLLSFPGRKIDASVFVQRNQQFRVPAVETAMTELASLFLGKVSSARLPGASTGKAHTFFKKKKGSGIEDNQEAVRFANIIAGFGIPFDQYELNFDMTAPTYKISKKPANKRPRPGENSSPGASGSDCESKVGQPDNTVTTKKKVERKKNEKGAVQGKVAGKPSASKAGASSSQAAQGSSTSGGKQAKTSKRSSPGGAEKAQEVDDADNDSSSDS
jgi:hypothetical protein